MYVCTYVCIYLFVCVSLNVSKNYFHQLAPSIHIVHSRKLTQVTRLFAKHLCLLGHLAWPLTFYFRYQRSNLEVLDSTSQLDTQHFGGEYFIWFMMFHWLAFCLKIFCCLPVVSYRSFKRDLGNWGDGLVNWVFVPQAWNWNLDP